MIFRRPKHVKIAAAIVNKWSFQIEAPSTEAYRRLSNWLSIVTADDEPDGPAPRVVGFSHTPPIDLGKSEADTYRADDD